MITYGSVCSGIEAATVAWHPLGWRPAFFAEIEAFPSAVLAHHYGSNMPGEPLTRNGVPNYGDFTQIPAGAGPVDILVGGTPCQPFSIAGKRLGLDDPRGNLALEYGLLAKRLGARRLVWENVPGVLSINGGRDFADFLGLLTGRNVAPPRGGWRSAGIVAGTPSSFGVAWRVLDAQYVRVDGYPRAVPQRRRRVFVVGYLGDWRLAAAVLFEPEGMLGHPPPRREAGQGIAAPIAAGSPGGSGYRNDADTADNLIAGTVSAKWRKGTGAPAGDEVQNLVALPIAATLSTRPIGDHAGRESQLVVAHTLRANGFDASEDGSGRGTPIIPVIAFDARQSDVVLYGDGAGPLDTDAFSQAVYTPPTIWSIMPQNSGKDFKARPVKVAQPLMAGGPVGGEQGGDYVQNGIAVRRFMPVECERLQAFPDGYTDVRFRGRPAADGPRYEGLGNSMPVNVMRWLGRRIDLMERLIREGLIG